MCKLETTKEYPKRKRNGHSAPEKAKPVTKHGRGKASKVVVVVVAAEENESDDEVKENENVEDLQKDDVESPTTKTQHGKCFYILIFQHV